MKTPKRFFRLNYLDAAGLDLMLKTGTVVDATLIAAPPSTKNREGKRDEEMRLSSFRCLASPIWCWRSERY